MLSASNTPSNAKTMIIPKLPNLLIFNIFQFCVPLRFEGLAEKPGGSEETSRFGENYRIQHISKPHQNLR